MASLRLLGFLGTLICLSVACRATMYTVGDTAGWDISSDLDSWVTGKRFVAGDVLAFQYSSSSDSVCEVTKKEFDGCDTSNAILKSTSGNTTFPLTKPGERYFVCCNRLYCLGGMKLHVHVEPNSTNASPVAAPEAARRPAGLLPRTSRSTQPVLSSSAKFLEVADPFCLFLLGFLGYLILGGGII
ncbi:stellacyanin-like [Beta vulgaris subsp. vulgaris]|uniref:stellacyanin-like n=1 Tax=Beta vulgaris subsp. vulgaris TaxID=3555 RepID=UPI002037449B|nr:stellacyanin-like [Beta vulgaris subsp. vulgaris]